MKKLRWAIPLIILLCVAALTVRQNTAPAEFPEEEPTETVTPAETAEPVGEAGSDSATELVNEPLPETVPEPEETEAPTEEAEPEKIPEQEQVPEAEKAAEPEQAPAEENSADPEKEEEPTDTEPVEQNSFAASLAEAAWADGIILISVSSPEDGEFSYHSKDADGVWREIASGPCWTGRNGLGKTAEGDGKTPSGTYTMGMAFGNAPDPGAAVPYLQSDESHYWVDDIESAYYNRLVSTREAAQDWTSAEHIASIPVEYAYAINVEYNPDCVPGMGSAIFLHCENGKATSGCIAIEREDMVTVLQNMRHSTIIVITQATQ